MTQEPSCFSSSSSSVCSTAQHLRSKCKQLQKIDTAQLEGRIRGLQDLLRLDADAACDLCQAVPSLLQHDRRALAKQLAQVRRSLSCETEDDARRLCVLAPLLLVLPQQRIDTCVSQLAEALRVPPHQARGLVRMLPQLPTLDPSVLAAKLDCLCRILDPGCKTGSGPGQGATASSPSSSSSSGGRDASAGPHGGSSTATTRQASRGSAPSQEAPLATASSSQQASPADSSPPSSQQQQQQQPSAAATRVLSRTLLTYPRLLTFSVKELKRHHTHLCQLLTLSHQQAAVLLAQDPWLLTMSPRSLSEKVQLLSHLLGCPSSKPEVLHRLLFRRPAVLARSITKISCTCRALSIWRFNPRSFKLRMVMARPSLMELHPHEMQGRCRWLRRFMLSNGFYHSALRRLPPNLLAMLVAMLPGAWSRLQYLAESEQEGAMGLVETAECRQAEFERRFPEYLKWREWKVKQMGADNPWRRHGPVLGFGPWVHRRTPPADHSDKHPPSMPAGPQDQQQQAGPGDAVPTVPVVAAEAGVVVSGGSRVCRPRWVVHQSLSSLASSSLDGEEEDTVPLPGAEARREAQRASAPVAAALAVGGSVEAAADGMEEEEAAVAALPRRPAQKAGRQRPAAADG